MCEWLKWFNVRIMSSLTKFLIDTMSSTLDSTILSTHESSSTTFITLDITTGQENPELQAQLQK